MNTTPNSSRLHIAIFGKTNVGKSALINFLTGQDVAIVSNLPGTTTDPVSKSIEINGIGACVLIDTAGFDDISDLGQLRINKTKEVLKKTDIAIVLFNSYDTTLEKEWINTLKKNNIPYVACITKSDLGKNELLFDKIKREFNVSAIHFNNKDKDAKSKLIAKIIRLLPEDFAAQSITSALVKSGDSVLLVMPQDLQAPKGRLILPQVQTIRDLLDNNCIITSTTLEGFKEALSILKLPPKLIITDSQVFKEVYEEKPPESLLTSFSVLFAQYKGDITEFVNGAKSIDNLNENSHVLIAESCTHIPLNEDIGRIKIPNMLKKRFGSGISVDIVSGADFPDNLKKYDLIVHCGACMFNRKFMLSRIALAKSQNVPITNYGVLMAHLTGILEKIEY